MNLYEIDIGSLWWFAAQDEFEAIELLREELTQREVSEEDIDAAIDDMTVKELEQGEAESISVVDEYGSAMSSLWSLFAICHDPQLVTSDFDVEDLEDFDDDEDY